MPKTPRPPRYDDVESFDHSTRWRVRSRTGGDKYVVDLGAYFGNGRCSCRDFEVRMEPILKHGKKPEDAVAAGIVEVREYHFGPWDACRCYHLMRARQVLVDAFISTLKAAEDAQRPR